MSLIPSESYSFPDLEGRNPKRRKTRTASEPALKKDPALETPPEVIREEPQPVKIEKPEQPPAPSTGPMNAVKPIRRVPRQPIRPAVPTIPAVPDQLSDWAPSNDAPPKPMRAVTPGPTSVTPEPATATPIDAAPSQRTGTAPLKPSAPLSAPGSAAPRELNNGAPLQLESAVMPNETAEDDIAEPEPLPWDDELRPAQGRRRSKLIRFIVFETLAVAALLLFAKLEVNERFSGNSLTYLYGVAMFVSALAAAVIPVIFYALPPTLPSGRQ